MKQLTLALSLFPSLLAATKPAPEKYTIKRKYPLDRHNKPMKILGTKLHELLFSAQRQKWLIGTTQFSEQQKALVEAVQELLIEGVDVHAPRADSQGNTDQVTVLHAAIRRWPELVHVFLSIGADPKYPMYGPAAWLPLAYPKGSMIHTIKSNMAGPFFNAKTLYTPLENAAEAYGTETNKTFRNLLTKVVCMLYEAGADSTDADEKKYQILAEHKPAGLVRRATRAKNLEYQLALLQRIVGDKIIKDLLAIIQNYIGLDYTEVDNVPLTNMGGPASAPCTIKIEEIS